MAKSSANKGLQPTSPSRQLAFHQLLLSARKTWLVDALSEALANLDPQIVKQQLIEFAPAAALNILGGAGIRDEHVFPTPAVLENKPTLVGYYRLLLGASQKVFYSASTGLAKFKSMETAGTLNDSQKSSLNDFCRSMGAVLGELISQISPAITPRDVTELRLLTLGSQFQGANNVRIGQQATADVFLAIADLVEPFILDRGVDKLVVKNASKRRVHILLATDPDVSILEEFGKERRLKIAVEIKGGTDRSNAHNRAGEAEKSHQKARNKGFRDFWTIIAKKGLNLDKLKEESPTTRSWFDVAQVLGRSGKDWEEFCSRLAEAIGVPLK